MKNQDQIDSKFMKIAISYANRGLGRVYPNPSVGCVLVKNGQIISAARTADGGRPHAETIAISKSVENTAGSTAYVTLEPCCHHGKSAPCTDSLIKAGIKRVVIAITDPFKHVDGDGIMALKQAGIEVITGICAKEAEELNYGFLKSHRAGLPMVTVKMATSLDGKIGTKNGEIKWISNELSRSYAHLLRAQYDAILVGSGTVRADDPMLNCRLPGLADHSPVRIIISGTQALDKSKNIIKTAKEIPTWIITSKETGLTDVKNIICSAENGEINLKIALSELANLGITRVLVEGGAKITTSLLKAGLVDRIIWIKAPITIGNEGIPAIYDLDIEHIDTELGFKIVKHFNLGNDEIKIFHV